MNFNFIGHGRSSAMSKTIISVQTFFSNEDSVGYFKRSTFRSLMEQLKCNAPRLYSQYKEFFTCVKDGFIIKNAVVKKTHLTNLSDYYFLKFQKGRIRVDVTIYDVDNIGQFINDYANNLIDTNFSLDDLIQETSK